MPPAGGARSISRILLEQAVWGRLRLLLIFLGTLGLTSAFYHGLLGTRFLQVLSGLERTRLPHAPQERPENAL